MKCGHCKRDGAEITVSHVRACSASTTSGPANVVRAAMDRTWQENKAIVTATVLGPDRPRVASSPKVPAGRYAIDYGNGVVKFFKVDVPEKGKWTGYTFVKRVAGDEEWPVRDYGQRSSILQTIGEDVLKASKLYGTEIGACGVCGRTLTDPESRAAGIGPICAAKF